jgi:hypothetical protein
MRRTIEVPQRYRVALAEFFAREAELLPEEGRGLGDETDAWGWLLDDGDTAERAAADMDAGTTLHVPVDRRGRAYLTSALEHLVGRALALSSYGAARDISGLLARFDEATKSREAVAA